ncbi:MAG TPA: hypothetical protein GX718_09980 [Brevibacterium sp.]|nr:hypothetical protein [Brevibacterium sp.]
MHILPDLSPAPLEIRREIIIPDIGDLTDTYQAALIYAGAGIHILPVSRGTKDVSSIVGRGWPEKASTDPRVIRGWFYDKDRSIGAHAGASGLVVLDVDHPDLLQPILREAIGDLRPPYQATRAASLDRGHYVFAQPPGVRINNRAGPFSPAGDVRGWGGGIMLAPSLHPEPSGHYRWIRTGEVPVLPEELVQALGYRTEGNETPRVTGSRPPKMTQGVSDPSLPDLPSLGTPPVSKSASHRSSLPGKIQHMLKTGHIPERFPSRSEARQAVATACVRAGYSVEEYCAELSDESNAAHAWYARDKDGRRRNGLPLMERDHREARRFVANRLSSTTPEEVVRTLCHLRSRAERHGWKGRSGSRDRQVYLALIDHARDQGSITVQVSARQAAEMAGVQKDTANRALQQLLKDGLLIRLEKGNHAGYAARYRFDGTRLACDDHTDLRGGDVANRREIGDYWAKVGPIAGRVYDVVGEGPRTAKDIAAVTGHHVTTIRKHLRRLFEDALVWRGADGTWQQVEIDDLPARTAELAAEYEWTGSLDRRRELHQAQRDARVDRTDPALLRGSRSSEDVPGQTRWFAGPTVDTRHGATDAAGQPQIRSNEVDGHEAQ